MSNSNEEQRELDSLSERFVMPSKETGFVPVEDKPEFVTQEQPRLRPKTASKPQVEAATKPLEASQDELKLLNSRIKDMENAIDLLKRGRDGIKLRAAEIERKPVDWNKIQERDIFDLDVNIDIIDHDMPDYMLVVPRDGNYVLRWVHKLPRRLGPMKVKGFQFCRVEDIEGELNIAMETDENGHIRFDDVILMKIKKSLYYGMLLANHRKALDMVDRKKAHQKERDRVIGDMRMAESTDMPGDKTSAGDFDRYVGEKKLNVYIPGEI